jgi:hypothetical protein
MPVWRKERGDLTMPQKLHSTRYPELKYGLVCPGTWRIFSKWEGETEYGAVGPQYPTKTELLCDLDRYAKGCGL